jgi:lipopolysaccharide exporter
VKLLKSSFLKNVSILMTGSAIAQGLLLLAVPILSRLYDPSDFGAFGLYVSIATIISVIASLRYELAIVIPKKEQDAVNLMGLSIIIVLFMTILSALLVFPFMSLLSNVLNIKDLALILWFIPLTIFVKGVYQVLTYWSTRKASYKRMSISQSFRSIGTIVSQIPLGFAKTGSLGLIGGQVLGQTLASIMLGYQIWRDDWQSIAKQFRFSHLKHAFREHIDYLKYSTPQTLINSISQNTPPIMLAYFFSSSIVGFYALCIRVLLMPFNLIVEAVRRVFFQKAAEIYNKNLSVYPFFVKSTLTLAAIALLPVLSVFFFGEELFSFVLGNEWRQAGMYASWLSIYLLFGFINTPSVIMVQLFKLQKQLLVYEIVLLVFRILPFIIGGMLKNVLLSIMLYSLVGAIFNLILVIRITFYLRKNSKKSMES